MREKKLKGTDNYQIQNVNRIFDASNIADENDLPGLIDRLNDTGVDPSLLTLKDFGLEGLKDEGEKETTIEEDIIILSKKTKDLTLQLYLRDVREITKQYGLLNKEQEVDLAKRIENGDNSAKETLINSNLRLVIKYANKFCNKGVAVEDLIQEGNLGLCVAAEKYDYRKGFRFSTYATWWILQRIRRLLVIKYNIINIPTHIYYKAKTVSNVIGEFQATHGRTPTKEEISKITGLPVRTVETTMNYPSHIINLENKLDDDCTTTVGDVLINPDEKTVEDTVYENLLRSSIKNNMSILSDKEKHVLEEYFFKGRSLQEIGEAMGRSRERIRQIKDDALSKLKRDGNLEAHLEDL